MENRAVHVGKACTAGQGGSECPCPQPHFLARKFKTRGLEQRAAFPFADEEAGVLLPTEWLHELPMLALLSDTRYPDTSKCSRSF